MLFKPKPQATTLWFGSSIGSINSACALLCASTLNIYVFFPYLSCWSTVSAMALIRFSLYTNGTTLMSSLSDEKGARSAFRFSPIMPWARLRCFRSLVIEMLKALNHLKTSIITRYLLLLLLLLLLFYLYCSFYII